MVRKVDLNSPFSFHKKISEHEHIHLRPQKTIERFLGTARLRTRLRAWQADYRFVFIEGSVQNHGDSGQG